MSLPHSSPLSTPRDSVSVLSSSPSMYKGLGLSLSRSGSNMKIPRVSSAIGSPRRKFSIEANINELKTPTQLLKFGKSNKGFRLFQITHNLEALSWHSKNKPAAKTKVLLKDVKEIRFGQRTDKFRRNNRPDLDHLSFSLIYTEMGVEDSLDLVCKDENEFQLWTRTLQALVDGTIPPEVLEKLRSAPATPSASSQSEIKQSPRGKRAGMKQKEVFSGSNDVYAFGWGEYGQCGFGEPRNTLSPQLLETFLGKGVVMIACGWSHTAALLENGDLLHCGNRVGTGQSDDYMTPTQIKIPSYNLERVVFVSISCGSFHTAAVSDRGQILTWGCNLSGQLGHGNYQDLKEPKVIESLQSTETEDSLMADVVCGNQHTAALSTDGKVYTWGGNEHGALGLNDLKDRTKPELVKDLSGIDILKIASGDYHMIACTKNETYAWGWNGCGQLGLGHEDDQHRPVEVESLRGNQVEDVACGAAHTVAIAFVVKIKTRTVYSWGSNANGQLGQGKKKRVQKPLPVPDLKDIVFEEVSCGSMHTVLRSEDGELFTSGLNKHGQLGQGHSNALDTFKLVEQMKGRKSRSVACGGCNTIVLTERGGWKEDREAKECMSCKQAFTFVNRKHHCRNCGGIFCNTCSSKKIAILNSLSTEPVRVCNSCYSKLGGR